MISSIINWLPMRFLVDLANYRTFSDRNDFKMPLLLIMLKHFNGRAVLVKVFDEDCFFSVKPT